jgi:hypothetical protein
MGDTPLGLGPCPEARRRPSGGVKHHQASLKPSPNFATRFIMKQWLSPLAFDLGLDLWQEEDYIFMVACSGQKMPT